MIILLNLLLLYFSTNSSEAFNGELKKLPGYNLKAPTAIITLPDILMEVSGITFIDSTTFACIQDEMGVIFFYNSLKGDISYQVPFAGEGDFEGITRAGNTIYVLRSEGILYEISDYKAKKPKVQYYVTGIPASESEGLCYDKKNKRLLISCKDGYRNDGTKNKQLLYSFDLTTKKLSAEPVFVLDIKELRKVVKDNRIKIPGIDKDKIDDLNFRPSDIALNPLTGKLFLLSASDYTLIVADMSGKIESIEPLRKEFFRQAEGITFSPTGDLFISNEGAGKKPTLVRFNYSKTVIVE